MNTPEKKNTPFKKIALFAIKYWSILLSIIALLLALIALLCSWKIYHKISSQITPLSINLKNLQADIQNNQQGLTAQTKIIDHLQKSFIQAGQFQQQKKQLALIEASYLIRLANLYRHIDITGQTSQQLLELAQQYLLNFHETSLDNLKSALAQDSVNLQTNNKLPLMNIINQLDYINQKIPGLTLIIPSATSTNKVKKNLSPSLLWHEKIGLFLKGFKDFITISKIHAPIIALLTPEQEAIVKNNIQLKILQAQWAILYRQPTLYKNSLNTADLWLTQYFSQNNAAQKLITQLTALSQINIPTEAPEINASLQAVDSQLTQTQSELSNKS